MLLQIFYMFSWTESSIASHAGSPKSDPSLELFMGCNQNNLIKPNQTKTNIHQFCQQFFVFFQMTKMKLS